jgi:hypothetical protein
MSLCKQPENTKAEYKAVKVDSTWFYTVASTYHPVNAPPQEELANQQEYVRGLAEQMQKASGVPASTQSSVEALKKIFPEKAYPKINGVTKKTGHNCRSCNSRNDYAEANQEDGSYLCYDCR